MDMLRSIGKQSGESVESEVTQKPATWHKIAWQVGYSTKSVITGKSTTESMLSPQNSTKQCRHVFNRAYRSRTGTLFLTLRSSSWISTASEQHKDSCVCGAVGTRSALEAVRLYLGCVRLCALQIDIYHLPASIQWTLISFLRIVGLGPHSASCVRTPGVWARVISARGVTAL